MKRACHNSSGKTSLLIEHQNCWPWSVITTKGCQLDNTGRKPQFCKSNVLTGRKKEHCPISTTWHLKFATPRFLKSSFFHFRKYGSFAQSNRQMFGFGPLLITVLFLALKKLFFLKKKILPPKTIFFFTFFLCNFSVRTLQCFQKKILFFLTTKS